MSTITENNLRQLRRLAAQQGARIHKLRNGGGYELIDIDTNALIMGDHNGIGVGVDLDDIEGWVSNSS